MIHGVADSCELADRRVESRPRTFECNHCQQRFQWKKNLYRHLRNYHGVNWEEEAKKDELDDIDLPFSCNVCGKRFPKMRSLYNHRARYHEKSEKLDVRMQLPDHKCEICGRGHNNSNALRVHL